MRKKPKIIKLLPLILLGSVFLLGVVTHISAQTKSPEVNAALNLLNPPSKENFEKASALLTALLKKNPQDVEARMGVVYLRIAEFTYSRSAGTGGLEEALRQIDAVLNARPNLEDGYRKKSLILFLMGKKEEGLKELQGALKKWPQSADLHEAYLAYLLNMGRVQEAERFSLLEGSAVKNKGDLLLRFGQVWLQAGQPDQAVECFEGALNLKETPRAWAGVGQCYVMKKDYALALGFFEKALALDANYYAAYPDLAFCYFQTGRPREAVQWLERYTRAFPNDLTALINLAGVYEGVGEKTKARLTWLKVKAKTRDPQQLRLAGERLEKLQDQK
jgi:tetratricopeptide (TPR) repeat protein